MLIEEATFTLLPEVSNPNGVSSSSSSSSGQLLTSGSAVNTTSPSTASGIHNSTTVSNASGSGSGSSDESSNAAFLPSVLNTIFSPGSALNSSQRIHLILFNDALLVAVPFRKNKLLLERFVPLERVRIVAPPERPPSDQILYVDAFAYVYKFDLLLLL